MCLQFSGSVTGLGVRTAGEEGDTKIAKRRPEDGTGRTTRAGDWVATKGAVAPHGTGQQREDGRRVGKNKTEKRQLEKRRRQKRDNIVSGFVVAILFFATSERACLLSSFLGLGRLPQNTSACSESLTGGRKKQ